MNHLWLVIETGGPPGDPQVVLLLYHTRGVGIFPNIPDNGYLLLLYNLYYILRQSNLDGQESKFAHYVALDIPSNNNMYPVVFKTYGVI